MMRVEIFGRRWAMAILYPFDKTTVELFSNVPGPGDTHRWIFQAAIRISDCVNQDTCFQLIRQQLDDPEHGAKHRAIPDHEIMSAVEKAYSGARSSVKGFSWPEMDDVQIADAVRSEAPVCRLEEVADAASVIPQLFWEDELVCYGPNLFVAATDAPSRLAKYAEKMQFIMSNPVKKADGILQDGKIMIRCHANVALRRYLVVEFDKMPDKEDQARLLNALSKALRLVMVVDSGGKSLHGWYDAEGVNDVECRVFYSCATILGGDPTRWDASGWVRMPGGTRNETTRQKIVYWGGRV
jgi:hypothetical protein